MFNTPPRTSIKTRSAVAREKLNPSEHTDDTRHETHEAHAQKEQCEELESKNELQSTTEPRPRKEGSLKTEIGDTYHVPSKKVSSSKSSLSARRKQLELEAAEQKAKIDKELIEKRLAADLAALESGSSSSSLYDKRESLSASNKVEEWFDKSDKDKQRAITPPPAPPLNTSAGADHLHLARAIENLAAATHASNTQLLSRLATTKDLPPFSGEPLEWLQFKKAFEESTKLCTYSDGENVSRLNRCLRGEAREAVSALLISDTPPKVIIEALELRFGRPELLIHQIASQFHKLPQLPQAYHTEVVSFAVKVKNYVAAAQSLNQADYLRSPDLLNSVISKCPSALLDKWVDYLYENENTNMAKLQIFSEFLHREATKVAAAGISHLPTAPPVYKPYKRNEDRRILVHSIVENNGDRSANCKLCRTVSHPLTNCNKFKRALRKDRWRIVKINKLCHKCLMAGHSKEICPAAPCDVDDCGMAHHQLLHWPARRNTSSSYRDNTQNDITTATNLATTTNESEIVNNISTEVTVANIGEATSRANVMLKIVSVNIHGPQGVIKTHALLDDGASVTLVSADLANILNLKGQAETLRIRGAWNSDIVCQSEIVKFKISNNNEQSFQVRARKISELDLPVQKLSAVNIESYEHLRNLKEHLCVSDVKPKLLIGQDNFELLLSLKIIYRGKNEPCATLTPLGWCLHGIVPANAGGPLLTTELALHTVVSEPVESRARPRARAPAAGRDTHTCADEALQQACDAHTHIDDNLYELVRRSFAFEAIGVTLKPRVNKDEIRAIQIIENSRLVNGRWEVSLPWKDDSSRMPDSYPNAYRRFLAVERKMLSDENFAARYKDRIQHLLENDYARPVTDEEMAKPQKHEWYIAHFGVDNPNKNKLRLVFDARAPTAGRSLNDFLLQGPDLLQSLLGIMLRFREKPVAIMGDIKDMFLRIKIKNEDQHALRFLWRENNKTEIKTYAMTSLIFGANCSPFIAQFIKNKNALRFEQSMPEAAEAVQKSHYMDDYIESVDDEQTAIKMVKEVTEIHQQGGFEIRNWSSNKKDVLDSTRKEALSDKAIRFKTGCDDLPERTLGLLWFPSSDTFGFDLSLKRIPPEITDLQRKPTKRELLRIFMSIFDIFGFLAPFTVKAKIILQNTWKNEMKWDDIIPKEDEVIFRDWMITLKKLQYLRIPRYLFHPASSESEIEGSSTAQRNRGDPACEKETTIELHVFCDAAPTAFACVGYWRKITNDGSVCASFIACKCRAAPIKYTTVAKLELQSAVIACRLADTIQRESRVKPDKRYFWTDSMIVLHQIRNNTRKYNVFVANRLGEIDSLSRSDEWHYVPSDLNIADKATKLNNYEISSECEWLRGPRFLYLPTDNWPKYEPEKDKKNDYALQVNTISINKDIDLPVPDAAKFTSWLRMLRCMATVLLFIKRCRGDRTAALDSEIMQRAEIEILRKAQMQSFAKEIFLLKSGNSVEANSRLIKLTPYLDENGLLRVGGRIDAALGVDPMLKRPVIIDGRHPAALLLVRHYHVQAAHSSNEMVINEIRQKYWLTRLRPTVRTVASRCLPCRIKRANPTTPLMGNLPAARLAHNQRPFTHCGVDLFGPMVVAVGRRHEKRYGVLFTCMTTRAVHIEVVPSLSADSFIMCLRRMAARRGWPSKMYSDNGTNFRGAQTELKNSFAEISQSNIKDDLINRGVEWVFISPLSPWMGGSWERQIRTVKTALKTILKERAPREEVLITLLAEVENMVNSRPLSHVSVDHEDPESLTPNHFLIGSSSNLPVPGVFDDCDLYRKKLWRKAQRLADMFWRRWIREILPTLLPRSKWHQEERNLRVGDVVIIVDPASPRNTWPKALIEKVHPGADGRVRVVDVRTKTGILTRPVARLAPLPIVEDDVDDCPERSMGGRM